MHADGLIPGKAHGKYETYVVELVEREQGRVIVVGLAVLTLLDEETATIKALRTHRVCSISLASLWCMLMRVGL